MTFHAYLSKAVQDDAQLVAERDRLALVARGGPAWCAASVWVLALR
jgi:hypothetical protein